MRIVQQTPPLDIRVISPSLPSIDFGKRAAAGSTPRLCCEEPSRSAELAYRELRAHRT